MEIQRGCVSITGQTVCYLQAGSGRPVLLIHGLLGSSFCWRFNVPALAQRFNTLAIDLPAFGESAASSNGDCSMQAQAAYLLLWLPAACGRGGGVVGSPVG